MHTSKTVTRGECFFAMTAGMSYGDGMNSVNTVVPTTALKNTSYSTTKSGHQGREEEGDPIQRSVIPVICPLGTFLSGVITLKKSIEEENSAATYAERKYFHIVNCIITLPIMTWRPLSSRNMSSSMYVEFVHKNLKTLRSWRSISKFNMVNSSAMGVSQVSRLPRVYVGMKTLFTKVAGFNVTSVE